MKVYQSRQQSIGKWVLAGLAFLFVMTFTLAEVNGVNIPNKQGDNSGSESTTATTYSGGSGDGSQELDPTPSAVPEPSTLILMGMGLGAAALWRNRKKA